ncbi:MAG: LysR substrate-binding domain-containing protein [Anaerolineae bacterium]|nr:LysR substrate-binding domain-containing protein [Anaerolineae bacterium]MDW8099774.1 LysR substrate-binding domain-containing protein [Anaerolineae bacterium]
MLNPESLQIFLVAAEVENFSLAARQLNLSQPAISQHISALEKRLGIQLFERRGRRIKLSAIGEALLPLVRDLVRVQKQIEEAALALSGEVVGHLTIGCATTSGKYVLPRLIAHYRERYPLVRVAMRIRPRTEVMEALLTGEVDVGVTDERIQRSGLYYRRFFQDEIVLIVPASHPWAARETVYPQELYQERFILREPSSGTYMTLEEKLGQVGIEVGRLETVLTLENSEAIIIAVEEGIGLGFVPCIAARRCIALGGVKALRIEGLSMTRWLYLVRNETLPRRPALHAFWQFLDERDVGELLQVPAALCAARMSMWH